jgi:hypothetical protein
LITEPKLQGNTIMTSIAKRLVLAVALVAAAAGAQAAVTGSRDVYTDGARSVQEPRNPYSDGARSVQDARSPYSDGARNVDPYTDGARIVAGMDRTGVSADPARTVDPYLDGAYA